jgi:phage terminase Nu1 subunit (DNA packaging protein)
MAKSRWVLRSLEEIAEALGVALPTVKVWRQQGMPGRKGSWDLPEVVAWLRTRGPWRIRQQPVAQADPTDPMLFGTSPELERYRKARADLSEIELAERRRAIVPREKVHTAFGVVAGHLRRAGEQLARKHGEPARRILDEALTAADAEIVRQFGADEGDGVEDGDESV